MRCWHSCGEAETEEIGVQLAAQLLPDGVLLLTGDLGSGKTVLARGVARGLGVAAEDVQSPTFTVIREHQGARGRLVHVDVYRLEPDEAEAIGLEEILAGPGVKVVEWAEKIGFPVAGALRLRFSRGERDDERTIEEYEDKGKREETR